MTTALRALYQQTWPRLENLVVNDASTDETQAVLEAALQQLPPRPGFSIRLLHHEQNRGAYAARNTGLAAAIGEFITTHDGDDWSHPQKLERQASALQADPGPNFSTTGYRARYSKLPGYEEPALLHYLTQGKAAGHEAMATFEGALAGIEGDPTFLVCAHQAEVQLHGAERSLLDVLSALHQLGVRVVVTLPSPEHH